MIGVTFNAFTNISLDTTATGIFIHLYCQVDMLKDSLQHMRNNAIESLRKKMFKQKTMLNIITPIQDDYNKGFSEKELETEMRNMYVKCVKHHYAILE